MMMKAFTCEADAIQQAHDAAMSKEPHVAVNGRLMKLIVPILTRWLEDEMSRDHSRAHKADMVLAAVAAAAGLAASTARTIGRGEPMPPHMVDEIGKMFTAYVRVLANQEAGEPPPRPAPQSEVAGGTP